MRGVKSLLFAIMLSALLLSAFAMGLAGSPHCLVMCSGLSTSALSGCAGSRHGKLWQFQLGRLLGYSLLGAIAGASFGLFGSLASQGAALRPIWTLLHAATLLLGSYLLVRGEQPAQLNDLAQQVWRRIQPRQARHALVFHPTGSSAAPAPSRAAWVIGVMWALLPCSLLYSAAMLAAITATPWAAASVMLAFGCGSALALIAGQTVLAGILKRGTGTWAVRLAGLLLLALSLNALIGMSLGHGVQGWCRVL